MSLNSPLPPQPSVSERRGQRLTPLQTNFSRPTAAARQSQVPIARPQQRPRPSDYPTSAEPSERVPLNPPPVKRQSSKSGLRSLFGRDKSSRKSQGLQNHLQQHDTKLSEIEEGQTVLTQGDSAVLDAPILSPSTVCATPKTVLSTPTVITSPTTADFASQQQRSKLQAKSRPAKTSEDKPPPPNDPNWKPPPLFQAYPQSVKHSCLPAPALSADSILRIHATSNKGNSREEEVYSSQAQADSPDVSAARKKKEDKERKHLRSLSETIGKADWTQKIYVITTSGYILQYAGDGKHDRLPEKMLQLGPKSVAFASDAIPGKHWVLQVSQSSEEDGSTTAVDTHKPLLSRFGFHRSHTRRLTRSFLLVFEDPDELSSWLLAVRAEIEARGGKKYVSERVLDDGMELHLRSKPSIRQMVKRDPNRFSNSFLQPQHQQHQQPDGSEQVLNSRPSSYISLNRRSVVNQPTSESRSGSVSTAQTEAVSPITSPASGRFYSSLSAASSPQAGNGAAVAPLVQPEVSGSPSVMSPKKRQSMYMYIPKQSSTPPVESSKLPRPQSIVPDPLVRSTSPPAPNFSVPSFSKRFTARQPPIAQIVTQNSVGPIHPSLREYDDDDDYDASAIASFPSPPQSPVRSLSSMSRKDSIDQNMTTREMAVRKQIRMSASEDSLGDPQRVIGQELPKLQLFPRIPRGNTAVAPTNHTSRPISLVAEDEPSHESPSSPPTGVDRQRPILYPNIRSQSPAPTPKVSHRKSMPGLSILPPSAPPPNCPLPKIPSPVDPSSHPPTDWSEAARSCKSPPPRSMRDRKSSVGSSNTAHSSYTTRSSMAATRYKTTPALNRF